VFWVALAKSDRDGLCCSHPNRIVRHIAAAAATAATAAAAAEQAGG
jgi:hypothetical protein